MDALSSVSRQRDLLTVDLHGLRAMLLAAARARGVTASEFVRSVLRENLAQALDPDAVADGAAPPGRSGDRVRLSLRISRSEATALAAASRQAKLPLGAFVSALTTNSEVLAQAARRPDRIAALVASCATMSTLSRNVSHLTLLLGQSSLQAAREYDGMLKTLNADVRGHLDLAAEALATLRSPSRTSATRRHSHR